MMTCAGNPFRVLDSIVRLYLNKGNYSTIIDLNDLGVVSKYRWKLYENSKGQKYVATWWPSMNKYMFMHRLLTNAPYYMDVDHRDHDTFNNTRENLLVCTHSENLQNVGAYRTGKLGIRGVCVANCRGYKYYVAHASRGGRKYSVLFPYTNEGLEQAKHRAIELRQTFMTNSGD